VMVTKTALAPVLASVNPVPAVAADIPLPSPLPSGSPPVRDDRDFDALVLPLRSALVARAFILERSRGEALDLVQDTLERALRGFHQFQPGTNVRRWLFRIMHNVFIDQYRRRAREHTSTSIDEIELAAPEPETTSLWECLGGQDLQTLLSGLELPFRQVVELHFFEERSYEDIGRSLCIPTATVGTRLLRARKKLRGLAQAEPKRAA
jgi:RNA polymerase sigma-70 factor, ECF subfamily